MGGRQKAADRLLMATAGRRDGRLVPMGTRAGRLGLRAALSLTVRLAASALLLEASLFAAPPRAQVVTPQEAGLVLLKNGDFEASAGNRPMAWSLTETGAQVVREEGRLDSRALRVAGDTNQPFVGASQWFQLNRTRPNPVVVRGWSKADKVSGGRDVGYSLLLSVIYHDDTRLGGQMVLFQPGSHDWEFSEVVIQPEKPIKTLGVYCYFRQRSGTAWFDDIEVLELQAKSNVWPLQGTFVKANPPILAKTPPPPATHATEDGFSLALSGTEVANVKCGAVEVAPRMTGGFFARDVAVNSDLYAFEGGLSTNLDLKLSSSIRTMPNHLVVEGTMEDISGRDRAITLMFGVPVEMRNWSWTDDLRNSRIISGPEEYQNVVPVEAGATGQMSRYPVGAIVSERHGLALGLDPASPALFRIGFHGGLKQFFLAYDFALVKDTVRFPRAVHFRFVIFRFDPQPGFRAAWQKYCTLFPETSTVRAPQQGLWAPLADVKSIKGWRDFRFRFHEGDTALRFDDENDLLSFRPSDPLGWWMPLAKDRPRSLAEVLQARDELRSSTNTFLVRGAVATASVMHDQFGLPAIQFRNDPGREPVAWSLNPNPLIPGSTNAATILWNDGVKLSAYGTTNAGLLDGEYLDALDSPAVAELDFRREHLAASTTPLTFARGSWRPAAFKGLLAFEFIRWQATDLRKLNRLLFASGTTDRFGFLCPWLDVIGVDTSWLRDETYQPPDEETLARWRTLAGAKPVLLRLNADFSKFDSTMVESYLRRSLAYGFWPGMARTYWQNPAWYNRDRALFKRYLPLVETVAEAGWQPVTHATCEKAEVLVERFGPDASGTMYFTLFNHTETMQSGLLKVDLKALRMSLHETLDELLSERAIGRLGDGWYVFLEPGQVAVIQYPR